MPGGDNASSIGNDNVLRFRSNDDAPTNILKFTNYTITTALEYKFKVLSAENDYSKVTYNNNLLLVDTDEDKKEDQVSVSRKDLESDTFELAYLKYAPISASDSGTSGQIINVYLMKYTKLDTEPDEWKENAYYKRDGNSYTALSKGDYEEYDGDIYTTIAFEGLTFKAITYQSGKYSSVIVVDKDSGISLEKNITHVIEVTIVTMNGVSGQITLVISDFNTSYAYGTPGQNYELVYGGYEHGKLNDDYKDTNTPRVTALVNNYDVLNGYQYTAILDAKTYATKEASEIYIMQNNRFVGLVGDKPQWIENESEDKYYYRTDDKANNYKIEYYGSVRGLISHYTFGAERNYLPGDESLIYYKNNNGKWVIASRAVAGNTDVTMIFNVIDESKYIVGRIYYSLMIQNDIRIGINPDLSITNGIFLYLGSDIYTYDDYKPLDEATYNAWTGAIYTKNSDGEYSKVDGDKPDEWKEETYYIPTATIIDLLQSTDGTNHNNVYITLEQYSTGNIIDDTDSNKALYNGNADSALSFDNVDKHLSFAITDMSDNLKLEDGTKQVSVDGRKLKITGNPTTGSWFTLTVYSKNVVGYGETFTITIQQYEQATVRNSQVNVGNGSGYMSGEEIPLFNTNPDAIDADTFAIRAYRLGYIKENNVIGTEPYPLDGDNVSLTYQVAVFDDGTSVANIKSSDKWDTATIETLTLTDNAYRYILPSVKTSADGNTLYQIVSIRVCINYNGESRYYYAHYKVYNDNQIAINQYYINNQMIVQYGNANGAWQTGNNYITLMDTKMDTNNKGLYYAFTLLNEAPADWSVKYNNYYKETDQGIVEVTPVAPEFETDTYYERDMYYQYNGKDEEYTLLKEAPTDWDTNYGNGTYYKKNGEGSYETVSGVVPEFKSTEKYYKANDVFVNPDKYLACIIKADETKFDNIDISKDGDTAPLTITLPAGLFTNEAIVTLVIKSKETNEPVLEHNWTFKADQPIENKHSKKLRDFFLLSEIGNQQYYNVDIIGIGVEPEGDKSEFYNKFVKVGAAYSGSVDVDGVKLPHDYKLKYVTYTGNTSDEQNVFTTTASYYVLVGHDSAMSIESNGDYINVTVNDDDIGNNAVSVNLESLVQIWGWQNDKIDVIASHDNADFKLKVGITAEDADAVKYDENTGDLTLSGINTLTSNKSVTITITYGSNVTRTIEVYFIFPINAKYLDENGYMVDKAKSDSDDYKIVANATAHINSAMGTEATLDETSVENNDELKLALLKLIKYNSQNVNLDPYSEQYNYFKVSVGKITKTIDGEGPVTYYSIKYVYNNTVSTYTRTLKIQLPIGAKLVDQHDYTIDDPTLKTDHEDYQIVMKTKNQISTAIGAESKLSVDDINSNTELKQALLKLITYYGADILETQYDKFNISIGKGAETIDGTSVGYYKIVYTYNNNVSTYTRTLYIAL